MPPEWIVLGMVFHIPLILLRLHRCWCWHFIDLLADPSDDFG